MIVGFIELTFDLEERGQELIFVLLGGYWIGELLAIVEGLQQGLEAVVERSHGGRRGDQGQPLAGSLALQAAAIQTLQATSKPLVIFCPAAEAAPYRDKMTIS
jgi:hypothetical protein